VSRGSIDPLPNVKSGPPAPAVVRELIMQLIKPCRESSTPLESADTRDHPTLIAGDPANLVGLDTNCMILVYSGDQLERFTRAIWFEGLTLDLVSYNRSGDRGFISFHYGGGGGGTLRARLVNGAWVFDDLESWVS
jgi:hypothetical protein